MSAEKQQCQNCKIRFTIEPEDFLFYEKISVPPPTWCPQCRMVRRMMFRNERTLYRRGCDLCGRNIVAIFSASLSSKVYCSDCWWSDKWDSLRYGRDYDFSIPFFEQFQAMINEMPILNLWAFSNKNSDYLNYGAYNKNGYLAYSVIDSEDIYFSSYVDKSFSVFDCDKVKNSELCYGSIQILSSNRGMFLMDSRNCISTFFLFDCVSCQDCFMSSNLRHKKFYIRNKPYSKEAYFEEIGKIQSGSYMSLEKMKFEFELLVKNSIHRFGNLIKTIDSDGDNLMNAKNAKNVYYAEEVENIKNCWRVYSLKDTYDITGSIKSELIYEGCTAGENNYLAKFYSHSSSINNSDYFHFCRDSSNLFGCHGVNSKSYCILNKQYTKEEYEKLVPRIIQHMNDMPYIDKKGRVYKYGEFFPPELSPFSYNETIAQEYFPLTKKQALEQGYTWKDQESRNYQIQIKNHEIPDHIKDVGDDILNKVIECGHAIRESGSTNHESETTCNEQCTEAFKIIKPELEFYRKMNLPLPRLCPNCRHYQRIKQRNPLRLWHRTCQCAGRKSEIRSTKSETNVYENTAIHFHGEHPCPNEFETSYAPERPEIVYCEACYNNEVV